MLKNCCVNITIINNKRFYFNSGVFFSLDNNVRHYEKWEKNYCYFLFFNTAVVFYVPKNTQIYYFNRFSNVFYLLTIVNSRSLFRVKFNNSHLLLNFKFNNRIVDNFLCSYQQDQNLKNIFKLFFFILFNSKYHVNIELKKIFKKHINIFKQFICFF